MVELVDDIIGVDMCGALKNCITLSVGFCVGMQLGMNVRAAVLRKVMLASFPLVSPQPLTPFHH